MVQRPEVLGNIRVGTHRNLSPPFLFLWHKYLSISDMPDTVSALDTWSQEDRVMSNEYSLHLHDSDLILAGLYYQLLFSGKWLECPFPC